MKLVVGTILGAAALGVLALSGAFVYLSRSLPTAASMRSVEFQVPLRVYTRTGELIAQIGEQRRIPVKYAEIPETVREAVLAAEDDRFFSHHGVDWTGVLRAVFVNLTEAKKAQGASTITMQAARNVFFTTDKLWRRKLSEMFVTFRMEREFTKEEILQTYLNRIFFGQRSYGIAAAAETFYGKRLSELSISEAATLAGILQLPSRYNPVTNPQAAQLRRNYVLRRMTELGYNDAATADAARAEPVASRGFAPLYDVEAPYVAEMARQEVLARFGPQAVNAGYKVYTTIDGRLQSSANRAVRLGLIEYDRRRGYRGPLAQQPRLAAASSTDMENALAKYPIVGGLYPAVVTDVEPQSARVYVRASGAARIEWDGLSWGRRVKNGLRLAMPKTAAEVVTRGDIVYVVTNRRGVALLAQMPDVQGALVALNPQDGSIASLVGGFDYFDNKFNRVTQAHRQPGSGFKPFIYSAALENGFTPASVIMDAPVVDETGEGLWRPENSNYEFNGPMRLREALVLSRNMVSIRLLRALGPATAIEYATRFGFTAADMPADLTLALGSLQATPLQMASGYAVFANGGFKIDPYIYDRFVDANGNVLWQADPKVVCAACEPPVLPAVEGTPPPVAPAAGEPPAQGASTPLDAAPQLVVNAAGKPVDPNDPCVAPASLRANLDPAHTAPRVISPQNAWLMDNLMSDVISRGTGKRARVLNRGDMAGKTGTSNDWRDAWFNGFTQDLVTSVWVGYDNQARSLGAGEDGSATAVPIWVHFMREALRALPQKPRPMPPGLVSLRVSPDTGTVADALDPGAISETFMLEHLPAGYDPTAAEPGVTSPDGTPRPPGPRPPPSSSEPLF